VDRERCAELSSIGHDVPGEAAEVIEFCEGRRFFPGASADIRLLAYAMTCDGRRELSCDTDQDEPEP
jgi:hypothetical protein